VLNFEAELQERITAMHQVVGNVESFPIKNLLELVNKINSTFQSGNKIAFVGNGGSAAEAIHLAAEFTGKCVVDHVPLHAICLNQSVSAITAIGNDYGFEYVFSRAVRAELNSNDILIILSTSGKSKNIINAMNSALEIGVDCYLWTGLNAEEDSRVNIMRVPSSSTPRIQEIHLMWGHIIAELVEMNWTDPNDH
jgi:D-sedoheptulose 7-phosphate isomerase